MPKCGKQNASVDGGALFTGLAGQVNGKNKVFHCDDKYIRKLRAEIQKNNLSLQDTDGQSQRQTLFDILQYLGQRGLNTLEGMGLGFYRCATRIQELEAEGWHISVQRERLIGPEGLLHIGVARYRLVGRRSDFVEPQSALDLEASC